MGDFLYNETYNFITEHRDRGIGIGSGLDPTGLGLQGSLSG